MTAHQVVEINAYKLWEKEGKPEGRDQEFWFRIESAIYDADDLRRARRHARDTRLLWFRMADGRIE